MSGLAADEDVRVLSRTISSRHDEYGAVDARLLVRVGDEVIDCEVTLVPTLGCYSSRGLRTWGSLDNWASDALVKAISAAEEADDFDRRDLIREIVAYVDEAAEENGL